MQLIGEAAKPGALQRSLKLLPAAQTNSPARDLGALRPHFLWR